MWGRGGWVYWGWMDEDGMGMEVGKGGRGGRGGGSQVDARAKRRVR